MGPMKFYGSCTEWPGHNSDLIDMIESSEQTSLEEFSQYVGADFDDVCEKLGYDKYFRMSADQHVSYWKSTLKGNPVVFFQWSAIEYVFYDPDNRS